MRVASFVVPKPDGDREVGITRAHLEEDAAKNVHVGGVGGRIGGSAHTNVDFNRGGTPLLEIVTEPDLRSADDAKRFLQLLRQTIVELGISDAEMEKGTLRADANVSVRKRGETGYRTRTELKNMNSFNFIARGMEAEIERQIGVWESGGEVVQQTFDFDAATGKLTPRRSKEEAEDYRYFPEPDLVPVEPGDALVERARAAVPELPGTRVRRLEAELDFELAEGLVTSGRDGLYARTPGDRRAVANVVMNELAGAGIDPDAVDGDELGKLVEARASLPRAVFAEAIARSGDEGFRAEPYLAELAVTDVGELGPLIDSILAANPGQVAAFRGGKEGLLGFFVGQVMKETGGKADPRAVNELLREKLAGLAPPRADAAEPLDGRAEDEPGRRVGHRRKAHVGTEVDVRQALQELGGAALLDPRAPVDDQVLLEPGRLHDRSLDRQRDARLALHVSQLLLPAEMPRDDLVAVQADPDARHLRTTVGVQRDEVRERVGLEQLARARRQVHVSVSGTPEARPRRPAASRAPSSCAGDRSPSAVSAVIRVPWSGAYLRSRRCTTCSSWSTSSPRPSGWVVSSRSRS